ncbi:MAG: hypothetical protein PHR65_02875 [Syntrophomonadaceae bacterium]|nr:hypothetical protein [Syntrophomonadaceae bacterium]
MEKGLLTIIWLSWLLRGIELGGELDGVSWPKLPLNFGTTNTVYHRYRLAVTIYTGADGRI